MPFPSMFKINQSLHDLLRHKMSFICYERTKPETDLKIFVIAYCHFDPQFKTFCWTINSAKFSLLREKDFLLLWLQANIPYNYSSWIGVIESFKKMTFFYEEQNCPISLSSWLGKNMCWQCVMHFWKWSPMQTDWRLQRFHQSETQRHNFEEPFAIEKVALFEKR